MKSLVTENCRSFAGVFQQELEVFVVIAVFSLEKDTVKEERRVMMSVSNFRLIEGLVYSAESAPKRRKPIMGKGQRTSGEARLPGVWLG